MNIMLVDDEKESRASVAEFLQDIGYQVTEYANGSDAWAAFSHDKFHLVLSDIKMPKMSGLELLRQIRSQPQNECVDVILFTGYGDLATSVEALRLGVYDYLLKPVNVRELASIINRLSNKQALKRENLILNTRFESSANEAAKGVREELGQLFYNMDGLSDICFSSAVMKKIRKKADMLIQDRTIPVLIEGETGTGKEVIARYIHHSQEDRGPLISLNSAVLKSDNCESELFGYVPGLFGLTKGKKGKLDLANSGTLFLDQVSEMPLEVQVKLLRVVEEREFFRVGGLQKIPVDVRIICATNEDLAKLVDQGAFRPDFYYRLNVARIYLPPLRQRQDDILPLANMYLERFSKEKNKLFNGINKEAAELLLSYQWPGNVRELRNVIKMVVLLWDDSEITPRHLATLRKVTTSDFSTDTQNDNTIDYVDFSLPPGGLPLNIYTNQIILKALEMHNGNKTKTAKYLGISRRVLDSLIKKLL